jgi:GTPase SAR1 family protein
MEASDTHVRGELARAIEALTALEQADQAACASLHDKLRDEIFNLVAAGQFKRGKSSVINALLGTPLLPVGVIPLTSVVTEIRYGLESSAEVVFESGERRAVALDALAEYATETHNPRNVKGVREVLIQYPSRWLESGVRLIDTPGIGSVYEHNTDVTQRYLPQADAVLFVGSVDQPMSRAELDFLQSLRPYAAKIFCLLNKTDYLDAAELEESLAFSQRAIEGALGLAMPLYPVSARRALETELAGDAARRAASGFPAFEHMLRAFMADSKERVWLKSLTLGALRILIQARLQVNLELAALAAPVEEVKRNLAAFADKKRDVLRARAEYRVLIESSTRNLLKEEIEPKIQAFKTEERSKALRLIQTWSDELSSASSKAFQEKLEQRITSEVRSAYDGWTQAEEPKIARAFERICERFSSEIQATVNDLLTYSARLFNLDFEAASPTQLWTAKSSFTYKFWYEPVGLKTLTSSLILSLPRIIGHRLIIAEMRKRAESLVEIHAGRLRHDLDERLKGNVASFCSELLSRIDATIEGIERAIESGVAVRDRGEAQASRRRTVLATTVSSMATLDARLGEILRRSDEAAAA